MRRLLPFVLVLLAGSVEAATAITAPGSYPPGDYFLANDITVTSGTALTFNAGLVSDRASINLNGKTIHCVTALNAVTIGISGSGPSNLVIEGGGASWIDGCRIGVSSSRQTRVQEVIFTNIKYMAMNLSGPVSRVILNVVENVGGVTDEAYSIAVNATGPGAIIEGNTFHNFYRQAGADPGQVGEGVPIILNASANGAVVSQNFLFNDTSVANTIGIFAGIGAGHIIQDNVIRNFDRGIEMAGASTALRNVVQIASALPPALGVSADLMGTVSASGVFGYPSGQEILGTPLGSGNLFCQP